MTIACDGPNPDLGVALRLAGYLDCQARALGENGFQAMTGGPMTAALLSGLVTIFVALIGYRMILGGLPNVRDGVGWAVRLGVVLALVTGWPAYQTLVYQVAIDAPGQVAAIVLPAAGLAAEDIDGRIQMAYDTVRLGSNTEATPPATQQSPSAGVQNGQTQQAPQQPVQTAGMAGAQPPLPQTASVLVLSTSGVLAALRIATGFLLAVGPLAVMSLLFDATLGLFSGWVRTLAGTALAMVAATTVTAIDLVMIESELARMQSYNGGGIAMVVDPQAITTLVLVFALVMLVAVLAAARMASAFRMPAIGVPIAESRDPGPDRSNAVAGGPINNPRSVSEARETVIGAPSRVSSITDALSASVQREQNDNAHRSGTAIANRATVLQGSRQDTGAMTTVPIGVAGRRSVGRRSSSATRRDRLA